MKKLTAKEINAYLRNKSNRFSTSNFTGDKKLPYGIIDRSSGKVYGYKTIGARNKVFYELVKEDKNGGFND